MKVEKVAFDPKWLESGEFVICDVEEGQEKGVFTNRLGWLKKKPTKLGVLVANKSQRDFAISQNGMEYIKKAKASGRSKEVFVLLLQNGANGRPVFVKALTVEEVRRSCGNVSATMGPGANIGGFPSRMIPRCRSNRATNNKTKAAVHRPRSPVPGPQTKLRRTR